MKVGQDFLDIRFRHVLKTEKRAESTTLNLLKSGLMSSKMYGADSALYPFYQIYYKSTEIFNLFSLWRFHSQDTQYGIS